MSIKIGEVWECESCKSVFSVIFDPTDDKTDVFESLISRHQNSKPDCVSTVGLKLINQFVQPTKSV